MKSEKGITLISLIIYVIGMAIVIALVSTLTSYFYKNIDIDSVSNYTSEYTKFTSVILDEINKEGNKIIESKSTNKNGKQVNYIIFSSGNQYTFMEENNSIYKNNIKICQNIELCKFSYEYIDLKYKLKVEIKTGNIDNTGDNAIVYTL